MLPEMKPGEISQFAHTTQITFKPTVFIWILKTILT